MLRAGKILFACLLVASKGSMCRLMGLVDLVSCHLAFKAQCSVNIARLLMRFQRIITVRTMDAHTVSKLQSLHRARDKDPRYITCKSCSDEMHSLIT